MRKFSEQELSILCGLADLGGIGMYDFPPEDGDPAFRDICGACITDTFNGVMPFGSPFCFDARTGWCQNMRPATPDDVAELLGVNAR